MSCFDEHLSCRTKKISQEIWYRIDRCCVCVCERVLMVKLAHLSPSFRSGVYSSLMLATLAPIWLTGLVITLKAC